MIFHPYRRPLSSTGSDGSGRGEPQKSRKGTKSSVAAARGERGRRTTRPLAATTKPPRRLPCLFRARAEPLLDQMLLALRMDVEQDKALHAPGQASFVAGLDRDPLNLK